MIERPMTPLDEPTVVKPEAMARSFLEALDADRGRSRVAESAFQNRITRALHQGTIGNPARFYAEFVRACQEQRRQVTVEVRRVFMGIEANLGAIDRMQKEFTATKRPGEVQLIATNDVLDAEHAVDLIELRGSGEGGAVSEAGLVQVKRSPMSDREVQQIHAQHGEYLRRLITASDAEHRHRSQEAEKALESVERFEELFGESVPDRDLPAALERYTSDAFLELFSADIAGLSDEEIDEVLGRTGEVVHPVLFKLIVSKDRAGVLPRKLAAQLFEGEEGFNVEAACQRLRRWVAENPVTREDLMSVTPGYRPSEALHAVPKFRSVVYHGDKVSVRELPVAQGDDKALTLR